MEGTLVCEAFHQTVTDFVSRKCDGACLVSSAILLKRVGYGELIQGYLINDEIKYYVRHYWCRIDGKDYDAGTLVILILRRETLKCLVGKQRRSTTAPIGYNYISSMDPYDLKKLEEGYQLYTRKPKKFWKTSPRWMKQIIQTK